jgi:uncharacterized protein
VKRRLAILLWSVDLERPEVCAAPFVYATTAAGIDCEVEVHFAGASVRLLVSDVAASIRASAERDSTVYHFMRPAADLDVRFLACAMALKAHVGEHERIVPEFSGTAGAAAFVQRALDPEWSTLVF